MLPNPRIRTVIADDSPLAVQIVCSCLQVDSSVEIVGTASDGAEALSLIEKLRPDLVLLDLQMPRMNGLEVASRLAVEFPAILVVIVTAIDVSNLSARLSAFGVHGVIAKQDLSEQLPALLHQMFHIPRA